MQVASVKLEVVDGDSDRVILGMTLTKELWAQIEDVAKALGKTPEDVASEALSAGLSMTHGVG